MKPVLTSDQMFKWRRVMAKKGFLPFVVAGPVFGHPEEYHRIEKAAAS